MSWSRRRFLRSSASLAGAGWVAMGPLAAFGKPAERRGSGRGDLTVLPAESAKSPVELGHFPSRLHAFVWRNWSLVPTERMAAVVGATPARIRSMGRAMGLGTPPRIPAEVGRRGYITIIKRNWHLLPYEQLLDLLGWDAAELAYTLREDDFLWVKLGGLKPRCAPLRAEGAGEGVAGKEEGAAGEVAASVRSAFGGTLPKARDPLFAFVERLSRGKEEGPAVRLPTAEGLRFCYSYFALYGDPLLEADLGSYPDAYLGRLAATGVNGVWLQGVLYRLAPFPWQPALSERYEERRRNLARLVERAKRHGIRVFVYLNEPRAMPLSFFEGRAGLKGVVEGDHATLCTSVPEVRDYLAEAVEGIGRAVPGLGGFFTITASENLTNCWSHGAGARCPRCAGRSPAKVIAEVNGTIQRGIEAAGTGQRLLAWDWGWNDAWVPEAVAALPEPVSLMSVSEWSLPIERGGVKATVGEYSISSIGPGPRASRHWEVARARGLRTVAKIQANCTWELSALPYLPVLANVAEHARRLRERRLDGVMLGWTLGGYPSPNLEVLATVMAGGTLEEVARRRFGPALAPVVVEAWEAYSRAFREFPFDGGVVYSAPLQVGPANLLWAEPTGYAASMVGFPYDNLEAWRGPYPVDVFLGQLEKVGDGFAAASAALEAGLAKRTSVGTDGERRAARGEVTLGRAAAIHFTSVARQCRFVRDRDRLRSVTEPGERRRLVDELERVVREEAALALELYGLQAGDSRLGFEASNHYFYVPADLAEKVVNCRWLLDHWIPGLRKSGA